MNTEPILKEATSETIFPPVSTLETVWKIDAEPANIIRLAEQGRLHIPKDLEKFEEGYFTGQDQSPLNEW